MVVDRAEIERLIVRVARGDRAAFDALYTATSGKLFAVAMRVLTDRAEAEDALQDIYVRIWQRAGSYAANGLSPMTWLITIARNLSIDRLRGRKPAGDGLAAVALLADPAPGPEAAAIAGSEAARVQGCLDELDPDRAAAVRGAYLLGETYADLAARHGVPVNTMRTWLRRSLLKLKECLSR